MGLAKRLVSIAPAVNSSAEAISMNSLVVNSLFFERRSPNLCSIGSDVVNRGSRHSSLMKVKIEGMISLIKFLCVILCIPCKDVSQTRELHRNEMQQRASNCKLLIAYNFNRTKKSVKQSAAT